MIALSLILIGLQAAAPTAVPAAAPTGTSSGAPQRFSILVPDACPPSTGRAEDVIVCGRRQGDDRLALPDDRPRARPLASNPYLTGAGALAATGSPCAGLQGGCRGQFDLLTPALLIAREAVTQAGALRNTLRDKRDRVPIALDTPLPAGHLEP